MKKISAVRYYGTEEKLAEALGISRQAVNQWGPLVPEGKAYKLQAITSGKLRVNPKVYESRA